MDELEKKLGYRFRDRGLLGHAMTHSSYANEHRGEGLTSNERLEFLGDSVLGVVVADYLFHEHPDMPEGELTRTRAALVCEGSLVEVARSLGVEIPRSNICGGGSKSGLWRTIMANVLGIPLDIVATEQGPGYGGAMLAMVAAGRFPSVQAVADALVRVAGTVEPEAKLTALYEERYRQFQKIYPACKALFPQLL